MTVAAGVNHGTWRLMLTGLLGAACGDPAVHQEPIVVGVVPYSIYGHACSNGANRESIVFTMDDEDDPGCSATTGDQGEGTWVTPEAIKPGPPTAEPCARYRDETRLSLCRTTVAPDAFGPLTTRSDAIEQFYAILSFDSSCPPHSRRVVKRIVNEDTDNDNGPLDVPELLYPNEVAGDLAGNYTQLSFCFFSTAPSEAELMTEFPDIGVPYAVFHDFDGEQPGWVVRKRWLFSDDSDNVAETNAYSPDPSDDPSLAAFLDIIENPAYLGRADTYFDLARVR